VRHTNPIPKTLTAEEQIKLLRETARAEDDLRDHMIFALALGTGLRVSELVALNVGDVKNGKGAKGLIELRPETTKGGRGGAIALPERLRRKVSRFLGWKAERGERLDQNAPLFCSRGGGRSAAHAGSRISVRTAQAAFTSWQERLGFDRHVTFHQLRHSFATNLWRQTGDLRLTQLACRHSSPTVTSIYAVPSTQDLVDAVQELPC
jgi:site-specific recombinase XerC